MSYVQGAGNNNGAGASSLSVTISSSGVGNLLVASIIFNAGIVTSITSVTDNQGQTWTQAATPIESTSSAVWVVQYYFLSTAAGVTTVTVNMAASFEVNMIVCEETGGFSAVDGTPRGQAQASVTSWSTGSMTTTSANGVAYVCSGTGAASPGYGASSGTPVTGTGITGGVNDNTTAGQNIFVERQTYSSSAQTGTGTCSSASNVVSCIAGFAGPATVKSRKTLSGIGTRVGSRQLQGGFIYSGKSKIFLPSRMAA